MRGTYTVQTHINYVNTTATEWQGLKSMVYTLSGTTDTQIQALWPACRVNNKYYFHPYLFFFFFLDRDNSQNEMLIFTCFPYTSGPASACDSNLNTAGTPTFKSVTLNTKTGASGTIDDVLETIAFTRSNAYVAVRYVVTAATTWQMRIYKLTFSGTSCTNYGVTFAASYTYSTANTGTSANEISDIKVIP